MTVFEDLPERLDERITSYDRLNHLEQIAMFIGKAQILELGLKSVLAEKFGVNYDDMATSTLGNLKTRLVNFGVRPDFITLLESVVEYRNHIAHEILANEAILSTLLEGETVHLEMRHLQKGIIELEQILLIFDWQQENDTWT